MFISNALASLNALSEQRIQRIRDLQTNSSTQTAAEQIHADTHNADNIACISTIASLVSKQITSVNRIKAELQREKDETESPHINLIA